LAQWLAGIETNHQSMKRIHLLTLCGTVIVTLALIGTTQAANEPSQPAAPGSAMNAQGKLDRHDHAFLKKAAEINLTEIQLGQIAEKVSSDPNVKKLASVIIKDHQEANKSLERLAASKGVTLPTEPSIWEKRDISSLEKEQGDKFNKEFLTFNQKGHEKALALFEKESARTQDPDIKAWANKMVPSLREHLAMALQGKPQAVAEKQKQQQQQPAKQHQKETKINQ
jgi:putative membrane protein